MSGTRTETRPDETKQDATRLGIERREGQQRASERYENERGYMKAKRGVWTIQNANSAAPIANRTK